SGVFVNPRPSVPVCGVDLSNVVLESNEANNACSDTVTVTAPDLTATLLDSTSGSTTVGSPWLWTIRVANSGNAPATYTIASGMLADNLPNTNITYGSPNV